MIIFITKSHSLTLHICIEIKDSFKQWRNIVTTYGDSRHDCLSGVVVEYAAANPMGAGSIPYKTSLFVMNKLSLS